MIDKKHKKNTIVIILFTLCSIVSIYIKINSINEYGMLFLLPLCYGFFFTIFINPIYKARKYFVSKIILITSTIRYLILPISMVFFNSYSGYGVDPSTQSINLAILLMCYEMLGAFVLIFLISMRKNKDSVNLIANFKSKQNIIYISVVVISLIGIILFPSILSSYRLIINLDDGFGSAYISNNILQSFFTLILNWSRVLLIFIFVNKLYKKFLLTRKIKYKIYCYFIIIINLFIITGTSRLSIILVGLGSLALLYRMFPEDRRKLFSTIPFLLFLLLGFTSYYKFFNPNLVNQQELNFMWLSSSLDAYFSGPRNVAMGIEVSQLFRNEISNFTFFSDLFRNVPALNRIFESYYSTTQLFNLRIYGSNIAIDQIVPLIAQSYIHFGVFFSPILTMLFYFVAYRFEILANKSKNLVVIFICLEASIWMGCLNMSNMSILIGSLITRTIPILLLAYLDDKLVCHK